MSLTVSRRKTTSSTEKYRYNHSRIQLRSSNILTYEGSTQKLSQDNIIAKLNQLDCEYQIAEERTTSGLIKYHCHIALKKRLRTRNNDFFDINGIRPTHTKVKPAARRPPKDKTNNDSKRWEYIHSADTKEEYWARCHSHAKTEVINNYLNLKAYADDRYRAEEQPKSGDNPLLQEERDIQNWIIDTIGDTMNAASSSDYQKTSTIVEELPESLRSTSIFQTTPVDLAWDNIIQTYEYQPVAQLQDSDYNHNDADDGFFLTF
jgi:hypothetical protein